MNAYTDFAQVYAEMMQDIPYEKWEKDIIRLLKEEKIKDGLVLDLGCGTGEMTRRLKNRGYDMIGVDSSFDMLQVATASDSEGILYLNQDMRSFELYGTVRAIVSICDSMNYIVKEKDFIKVLKLVNNYLDPKGIFVFDLKTVHFFRDVTRDSTIAENLEHCSYIWENYYRPKTKINESCLTLFTQCGEEYRKSEEVHKQRGYTLSEIKQFIKEAGMDYVKAYDEANYGRLSAATERMVIVARERGK
ncbi:MAG: class I SAM-dependent methyltransferase [Lachnospiraceae bacterium]|nr:class I SAM-dependent methyltransferase [Lachnospiraceae bacterium]